MSTNESTQPDALSDEDYAKQAQETYQQQWAFRKDVSDRQILERRKRDATFGDYLTDIPMGAVEGGVHAVASAGDLMDRATGGAGFDPDPIQGVTNNTWTGNVSSGIAQFAVAYAATSGLGAVGTAAKLGARGKVALGLGRGAIADFVGFTGNNGRLSDLIEQHPLLSNPITRYLASDPGDSWAEKRFKNSLEGLGLGAATELLFHSIRGAKAVRDLPEAKSPELREYLEKQIDDSHTALADGIDALESGESSRRASSLLDTLESDKNTETARQLNVAERSSAGLEDGTRRVIPEGERLQPVTPEEPLPMDVTKSFESRGVKAPGIDLEEPAGPNLGKPGSVVKKPGIGTDVNILSEPVFQGSEFKGEVPSAVHPASGAASEAAQPFESGGPYRGALTPPDAPTVKFEEGSHVANGLC